MLTNVSRQKWGALFVLLMAVIAWGSVLLPRASTPEQRMWQQRGLATADNPKAARRAIIEAIYARRIVSLTEGYELAVQRKPDSPVRIANFAHAAAQTNYWSRFEETQQVFGLVDRGYWTLRPQMTRELSFPPWVTGEDQNIMLEKHNAELKRTHGKFTPSTVADAWLAWSYRGAGDYAGQARAIRHALALDPSFAEAYLALAGSDLIYYGKTHKQFYIDDALRSLQTAEKQEPEIRTLCLQVKLNIDIVLRRNNQAKTDQLAYASSWPDKEGAEIMRQDQARLQRSMQYTKNYPSRKP